ncbi:hypothetical protein BDV06DRAFT_225459 [Aspergillus oleicola]
MALRRSSRLSAVLLQPTIQAQAPASNRITKPRSRKASTKEKQKKTQAIKDITSSKSLADTTTPILEPNPSPDRELPLNKNTKTKTKTKKSTPATTTNGTNGASYWESTAIPPKTTTTKRPQTPPSPPLNRPVEPHLTNATLLTPHGSSLVAFPAGSDTSPSKTNLPRPTATTGTLLEKATAHLIAADARLEPLIKAHPCNLFSPEGLAEKIDPFRSLVGTIIGQQVSGGS